VQVILVERNATLGGRTALLYRYLPKMCHPACGSEINMRRLKGNRNVRVMTMAEVIGITGQRGDYTVKLKLSPRSVNANCTACGDCAAAVEMLIDNLYECGQAKTKAAYLRQNMAYPIHYVLAPSIIGTADADDHGADMIVTPCQLCQANVEIYQSEINKKKGTKLATPVVYYSQLMTVAYGGSLEDAGLDGHVIQQDGLQQIAERKK
jgi:heterodisulfide reductase subunit A-like polyferredoxin